VIHWVSAIHHSHEKRGERERRKKAGKREREERLPIIQAFDAGSKEGIGIKHVLSRTEVPSKEEGARRGDIDEAPTARGIEVGAKVESRGAVGDGQLTDS